MHPVQYPSPTEALRQVAALTEQAIMDVRSRWFEACQIDVDGAVSVREHGGELLMLVQTDPRGAEALISTAAERGAYVVATSFSIPSDLPQRLRRRGFKAVQRHWAYLFDPQAEPERAVPARRFLSLLRLREPAPVRVHRVREADLPIWNEVCWHAFGPRGGLEESLRDKRRAYANMGERGKWFLATIGSHAVGTACLYQGTGAAQVLAVGTLPGFRSRGVATAIMQHLIAEWRTEGEGTLFLDTQAGSAAERLYMRLGFRPAYLRELYAPSPPT